MSKFNGTKVSKPTGKNMAGGVSYDRTAKKEIVSVILNSMLTGIDSYYESEEARMSRIEELIKNNVSDNGMFIAKAMIYTRNEGRLRSISHYMACLLTEIVKGQAFLKPALVKTIVRADDMTEMLSLWNRRNKGKMVPNSLRRAFKIALETKFQAYHLKKYAQTSSVVKMKDVVKMAHPSPKNFDDKDIFKRVIEDTLDTIETAETINSSKNGKDRVDAYMTQIKDGKMGYMAAVKNIRTMLENGITERDLKIWANMITDPKKVSKSMMLPFRFIDAWNVVCKLEDSPNEDNHDYTLKNEIERVFGDTRKTANSISMEEKLKIVKNALERAFGLSSGNTNIALEGEKVAILLDESGSMGGYHGYGYSDIDENKTDPFYIGKVLAASMKMGMKNSDCLFYTWADTCTKREVTNNSPFKFINSLNTKGGGTDVSAPLKKLISEKTYVDKIVILTDLQMYSGYGGSGSFENQLKTYVNKYRNDVNPNVKILFWTLCGYGGGTPIDLEKTSEIFEVAGYSDKMLEIIPKLWNDKDYLINVIEAIEL